MNNPLKSRFLWAGILLNVTAAAQDRPNILWITCEDISPYLGSYGCAEAYTPNLDRMAAEGVRYTNAFCAGPVSAVSRSAILTGMHSSTIGTHQMRSKVQLPENIPAYPKIFRKAGYYCTNNSKEDYNSNYQNNPSVWDESSNSAHYRNRKNGQPFFAVFNIMATHESQLGGNEGVPRYFDHSLLPAKTRINPSEIKLPPYHPDLPKIRNDWARFHDLITYMDSIAGTLLKELEKEGLAENTIVFFYSDNGGILSRSKRYPYDVGMRVPLIVRFPEKWKKYAPAPPGSTVDRLVTFVDLPKTMISIAGLDVPEIMQGSVFLGPGTDTPLDHLYFYRDRMSERYDFCRTITDGRYYYIRNFNPHRPWGRDITYGPQVQENWVAWEKYYDAGSCNDIQSQFYKTKPLVEFFNTKNDPWHVSNLAGKPEYSKMMSELEKKLDSWMIKTRDLGLIPEPLFCDLAGPQKKYRTLYEFGQSDDYQIEKILDAAKLASSGDKAKMPVFLDYLKDNDPVIRNWGAYGLFLARSDKKKVQKALMNIAENDSFQGNRVMAAQALGLCGLPDKSFKIIMQIALETNHGYVFLQSLNALQYAHVDDRIKLDDWKTFQNKKFTPVAGEDVTGFDLAQRIVEEALRIWPERQKVD